MKYFKTLPLSFAIIFLSTETVLAQQYVVRGQVINKEKKPIELIQVNLVKNDTVLLAGIMTDDLGRFSFKAEKGNYRLILERLGSEYYNQNFDLIKNQDLGEIEINESILLEGVTITAQKKLIERKVDRLIYNVSNSIASQGMNGLDAIKTTPLVKVQDETISLIGKSGVSVMVNDRIINLSGAELSNYLRSLRSEDISKIEVITAPPSKYDASGNSGLLNIIMKKNPNLGWSGSINTTYQRNHYNGIRLGGTINYQSKTLSSSLRLRQHEVSYLMDGSVDLLGNGQGIYTTETRKDKTRGIGINYSLDIKINNKSNAGLIYDFGRSKYNIDADGQSAYLSGSVQDSVFITPSKQRWNTPSHTLNLYYDLKIDSLGKKLSLGANYLSNVSDRSNNFQTINSLTSTFSSAQNNSNMNYKIYSLQADLTLPYKWATVEVGTKYTLLKNNSYVAYYDIIDEKMVFNPANSNIFDYKEHNSAAYISVNKDFNKYWSAKAGLRYEYTSLEGKTPDSGNETVTNKYGKLFPTVYVSYKPNEKNFISVNYSRRISRPGFQSLNPFRWYKNEYMYFTGNPFLLPTFNDNFELNYALDNKLNIGLYHQYSKDNTTSVAELENGIFANQVKNGFNKRTTGITIGYYNTFFKRWEISLSTDGSYSKTLPTIRDLEALDVYSLYYSIYNTIALNKAKSYSLLVNFWHQLPFVYANNYLKDQMNFSFGFKASLFEKRLNLSAVVNDVFRTLKNDGYTYNNALRYQFFNYNDHRNVTISLTYSIGSSKVKGTDKRVRFDDKNRIN
ncbi:TonB-dependent receptor domain-containing protein [Chryseobacterium sp. R2ACT005]|uniref:TonB-dependent receptor domain-containing protein n=1 Tax=Chryseobacterium sp. R2ACT005 TaxID=3416668 RepID=UPI003CE6821B